MAAPPGRRVGIRDDRVLDPAGFAHRIGQRFEVVRVRDRRRELTDVAQNFPAARHGERDPRNPPHRR